MACLFFSYSNLSITTSENNIKKYQSSQHLELTGVFIFSDVSYLFPELLLLFLFHLPIDSLVTGFLPSLQLLVPLGCPHPAFNQPRLCAKAMTQRLCFRVGLADLSARVVVMSVPLTLDLHCFP